MLFENPLAMFRYSENVTFTNVLAQPSQWGVNNTSLTTIFIAIAIVIVSAVFRSSSDDKIHNLGGFYLVTAWAFFSKRYDFMQEHFKKTKIFRFNLLRVSFLYSHIVNSDLFQFSL